MNIYPRSTSSILAVGTSDWWAQVDSNHRPRAYQARALTTWAMSPCKFRCISSLEPFHSRSLLFTQPSFSGAMFAFCLSSVAVGTADLVEMMGIEPMTPCLQGRCSPSWATPPYWGYLLEWTVTQNWTTMKEALSSRCALSPSFFGLVYTNTKDQWLSHYLSCSP